MSSKEPVQLAKELIVASIDNSDAKPKKTDFHKILFNLQKRIEEDVLENKLGGSGDSRICSILMS